MTAVLPHTRSEPAEPVNGQHRPLRVVHPSAPVDLAAAERAAAAFLAALGVDVDTEPTGDALVEVEWLERIAIAREVTELVEELGA